jgi:hypothetical protein
VLRVECRKCRRKGRYQVHNLTRNFGLSFARQGARPNPGVSWRPKRHHVGATIVVVVLLLLALAMI